MPVRSNQTWCSLNFLGAFDCYCSKCCLLCAVDGKLDYSIEGYQGIPSEISGTDVLREITR